MDQKNKNLLTFACVATGSLYGKADLYINRLYHMLERFSPSKFQLICITDRPRSIENSIIQMDCSQWSEFRNQDTHPTYHKIGLFNPRYLKVPEFFYLDLSLIIKSPLAPLITYSQTHKADLLIIDEWHYKGFNSCVMRIRNRNLSYIYEDFVSGKKYPQKIPGDQDYIHESVRFHNGSSANFPDSMIISFKKTMRLGLRDWKSANQAARDAIIVKFHGKPKMHDLFKPGYAFLKYRIKYLLNGKIRYPIDISELKRQWIQTHSVLP